MLITGADPLQGEVVAALGLGGNLGDPVASMAAALQALDRHADCRVQAVSRLYRTPPWGVTDQADFINACALVVTTLAPQALLEICLDLERAMKRLRRRRWGPRTLDIDILLYGQETLDTPTLTIPHPRMLERGFVLRPLADIAASTPIEGLSVASWLARVDQQGISPFRPGEDWWKPGSQRS